MRVIKDNALKLAHNIDDHGRFIRSIIIFPVQQQHDDWMEFDEFVKTVSEKSGCKSVNVIINNKPAIKIGNVSLFENVRDNDGHEICFVGWDDNLITHINITKQNIDWLRILIKEDYKLDDLSRYWSFLHNIRMDSMDSCDIIDDLFSLSKRISETPARGMIYKEWDTIAQKTEEINNYAVAASKICIPSYVTVSGNK